MTASTPGGQPPAGRPLPDAADLRLLAELSRGGGSIGLAQAAWQAGMPQAEAAARLVQLAESGFPLRLVAQGDPGLLWQVVQRGPVVTPPAPGRHAVAQRATPADPRSTWGLPGSADWTRREAPPGGRQNDELTVPPPTPQATRSAAAAQTASVALPAVSLAPALGTPLPATGLEGEQLTVTATEIIDPATEILTSAGYRLDESERAILVNTSIGNAGPAPHECMPDLYLFLLDAQGATLAKAPVSVAGYPAHRVGVPAGTSVDGWTVFLIDAGVTVSGVRWCVRPDLTDRTLTWSVSPS